MRTHRLPPANVAINVAAELDQDHGPSFADLLADAGLTDEQIEAVEKIAEREIEKQSFHRSATVLRIIFTHISGCGTTTAALAYSLGLGESQTLADLAGALGVSKQAIHQMANKLRPMLGELAVYKPCHRPRLT